MADNKQGRDKKAHDAERRRRERDLATELERLDEPEPPIDERELGALETKLEAVEFPATGREILDVVGSHHVESNEGSYAIEEVVPDTNEEAFESPTAVRVHVQ